MDVFSEHKTLDEFILIDRVSNMTSVCGVVKNITNETKNKDENIASKYKDLEERGDVFEEFYYNTESLSAYKYKSISEVYTIGEEIQVKGER